MSDLLEPFDSVPHITKLIFTHPVITLGYCLLARSNIGMMSEHSTILCPKEHWIDFLCLSILQSATGNQNKVLARKPKVSSPMVFKATKDSQEVVIPCLQSEQDANKPKTVVAVQGRVIASTTLTGSSG